jgi:hypothetical protein
LPDCVGGWLKNLSTRSKIDAPPRPAKAAIPRKNDTPRPLISLNKFQFIAQIVVSGASIVTLIGLVDVRPPRPRRSHFGPFDRA